MITFTDFYQIYPRKVGRRAAELEWIKAMKRGEDPLAIMDGLKRNLPYLESRPMEFRPHPRTWLSQGRWEDEPQVIAAPERRRTVVDAARDIISDSRNDNWFQRLQH